MRFIYLISTTNSIKKIAYKAFGMIKTEIILPQIIYLNILQVSCEYLSYFIQTTSLFLEVDF